MTKTELIDSLVLNNESGLNTQDYADALGKPFMHIRGVHWKWPDSDEVMMPVNENQLLTKYLLPKTDFVPLVSVVDLQMDSGAVINEVILEVIQANFEQYWLDYTINKDDDILYVKLTGEEANLLINECGNIGMDIVINIAYTIPE